MDDDEKKDSKSSGDLIGTTKGNAARLLENLLNKQNLQNIDQALLDKIKLESALKSRSTYNYTYGHTVVQQLESEVSGLRDQINTLIVDNNKLKDDNESKNSELAKINQKFHELIKRQNKLHLLDRIHSDAYELILNDDEFVNQFSSSADPNSDCDAFVVSIDIRRSTELMLRARTPKDFSNFINNLCNELKTSIINHYGIFDKFTGDGVLAFFPQFYSGDEAALNVLDVCKTCHDIFNDNYSKSRNCFSTVLKDIGLGIGVDYGPVKLINISGVITVVGTPVVHACRLSSGPPNSTLFNQRGYEQIVKKHSQFAFINETQLDIKHNGTILAYEICRNKNLKKAEPPNWLKFKADGDQLGVTG